MNPSSSASRVGLLASIVLLSNCSGGGGTSSNPPAPTVTPAVFTIPGPYSQVYTPNGGTAFTVTAVKITYVPFTGISAGGFQPYQFMRIDTTFSQDITNALPPPGSSPTTGTQLGLYVGLDTDANPSTGGAGIGCAGFAGGSTTGDDAFIDDGVGYGRLSDGNYALVSAAQSSGVGQTGEAITSVSGNVLTQIVDLSKLASYTTTPKIGVYLNVINGTDITASSGPKGQCVPSQPEYLTS